MYFLSDAIAGLIYHVLGYRKEVVMQNLLIAFPEKTEKERIQIAKAFYLNFTDTFIETIKLLSISEKGLRKRFSSNIEVVDAFYDQGVDVQLEAGHFFNWEFINLGVSKYGKYPFVGVYMPVSNKAVNRIMMQLRSRYGTILIPATDFRNKFREYAKDRYSLGLAADQNPGNPANAHWVYFFNRLTPFVTGPEKGAKLNNIPVIFANFYKKKRGYYHIQFEVITTEPRTFEEGKLTQVFASYVEKAIKQIPDNYLWSHKRWKWEFDEEKYGDRVIK